MKLVFDKMGATFYKSNGHTFVVFPVESDYKTHDTYIIEEVSFFGLVNKCEGDEITIRRDKNRIYVKSGKRDGYCGTTDDYYPAIPKKEDNESYSFNDAVLDALFFAKTHTLIPSDKTYRSWQTFVHVSKVGKNYYVVAFNGFTSYIHKFSSKLPSMVLDAEAISVIAKLGFVTYTSSGSYDIFEAGGALYGFIKPEAHVVPLEKVLEEFEKREKSFVIERKKVVNFCESVLNMLNSSVLPQITISGNGGNFITMNYDGIAEQGLNEELPIVNDGVEFGKRNFDPEKLLLATKELPYDELIISILDKNVILSTDEEKNYLGSVMSLATI